jgi:predicted aconitase with swiveling domain
MSHSGPAELALLGTCLMPGEAEGELLRLDQPLSFWGGVDPASGTIIDVHHPQRGYCIRGRILLLPGARGSTAGPGALLETICAGNGPCGILLTASDTVCVIAVTAAMQLGMPGIPVLDLGGSDSQRLKSGLRGRISGARVFAVSRNASL